MSTRNAIIVGAVVVIVIVVVVIVILTNPGGPIIVVQPEPTMDSLLSPPVVTGYRTIWRIGCPIAGDPNNLPPPATSKAIDDIPFRFANWASVEGIFVTRNSTGATIEASRVEFTVDSRKIVVSRAKKNTVPDWEFKGNPLKGKAFETMPNWPAEMWGSIGDLVVTDANQVVIDPPIPLDDLVEIRIKYNKHALYKDCE